MNSWTNVIDCGNFRLLCIILLATGKHQKKDLMQLEFFRYYGLELSFFSLSSMYCSNGLCIKSQESHIIKLNDVKI